MSMAECNVRVDGILYLHISICSCERSTLYIIIVVECLPSISDLTEVPCARSIEDT